jgi:hypothetical protein
MALMPILHPPPGTPERRTVPRSFVAFVKYVTICVPFATLPRLTLSVTAGQKAEVELALV